MTEIRWVPSSGDDEDGHGDDFHSAHPSAVAENGFVAASACLAATTREPWIQNAATLPFLDSAKSALFDAPSLRDFSDDAQYNALLIEFTYPIVEAQMPGVTPDNEAFTDLTEASHTQSIQDSVPTCDGTQDITLRYTNENSRCMLCVSRHLKCETFVGKDDCHRCTVSRAFCIRFLFSEEPIFKKWANADYRSHSQWVSRWKGNSFLIKVFHFANGTSLNVRCRQFEAEFDDQTTVWAKSKTGWESVRTPALGLDSAWEPSSKKFNDYIASSVKLCIEEADSNSVLRAIATQLPKEWRQLPLLACALKLWAANRLLVKGWQTDVGIPVETRDSPFFNTIPAPRVLQHQLDRMLELYVYGQERRLFRMLRTAMTSPDLARKEYAFYATLTFLNTIERDTWRLMYWTKHIEERYKWRHPEHPQTLINRNLYVGKLLIAEILNRLANVQKEHRAAIRAEDRRAISYDEVDESSFDGMLTRLALDNQGPGALPQLPLFLS